MIPIVLPFQLKGTLTTISYDLPTFARPQTPLNASLVDHLHVDGYAAIVGCLDATVLEIGNAVDDDG